jgi:hypothetical protein
MFPPRKRKLYTPITPPSDEENDANQVSVAQQREEMAEIKKIPQKMCVEK